MSTPGNSSENLLANIRIATPCTADWSTMSGDDKTRFCQDCKLNVHNLSAMTKSEAESLMTKQKNGERVCISFFQRADGTVLTQDCPVGIKLLQQKVRRTWNKVASFVSAFMCLTLSVQANPRPDNASNKNGNVVSTCPSFASRNPSLKTGTDAYDSGQYQIAKEFFEKTCAKDPKNDEARYYLALSLQALNQVDAALVQYKLLAKKAAAPDIKIAAEESVKALRDPNLIRTTGRTSGMMAPPERLLGAPVPARLKGEMMPPEPSKQPVAPTSDIRRTMGKPQAK